MSHIFGANAQVAILNELFATTRTKARGRKGLISVGSPFATRLSSRDESCLSIKHHDSMGRVSLFRCEHRGCNFKRTFCNQAYEKRVFFLGAPPPPSPTPPQKEDQPGTPDQSENHTNHCSFCSRVYAKQNFFFDFFSNSWGGGGGAPTSPWTPATKMLRLFHLRPKTTVRTHLSPLEFEKMKFRSRMSSPLSHPRFRLTSRQGETKCPHRTIGKVR